MYVGGGGWNSSELIMSPMVMCVLGGIHKFRTGDGGDRRSRGGRVQRLGARCAASYGRSKSSIREISRLCCGLSLINVLLAGECYCRATSTGGGGTAAICPRRDMPSWLLRT